MVSVMERRKHARSKHSAGSVSRHAQQRLDERVRDVMARRDAAAAQRRDAHRGRMEQLVRKHPQLQDELELRPYQDGRPRERFPCCPSGSRQFGDGEPTSS